MYLARFSYNVLPVNRRRAVDFIRREVEAAQKKKLQSRLLIPLTRGKGEAALQFEVELTDFDQLEQLRRESAETESGGDWMRAFSEILLCPPEVEILRLDDRQG